jgi:multiple sugar transport system substrate-binding protein
MNTYCRPVRPLQISRAKLRVTVLGAATAALAASPLAACGSAGGSGPVLTIAYSSNYEFDTSGLTTQWWHQLGAEFDKSHPGATIKWEPIPGNYTDIVSKLSLLYRSPSTAPDVAEIPNELVPEFAASGYLLPLNSYVGSTSWWSQIPTSVQNEDASGGKVYAVSHGENTNALMYNKQMFARAGIPVPWQPSSWQDIITAAQKIKNALPGVWPLWINAGTSEGANDESKGISNFIDGTTDPNIIDPSNGKVIVDSPGIRAALGFYQQAFSLGLTPPVATLFGPSAVTDPTIEFPKGTVAIALAQNFYPGSWTKFVSAPYWAQAADVMGVAYLPSNYDPSRPASTLGGLGLGISAKTKYAQAAFDFISIAQQPTNIIDAANWGGWIPPEKPDWTASAYTGFAFDNAFFATVLPDAIPSPSSANYPVWAQGMGNATGALAQNPTMTVADAVTVLENYVTNQLGASHVEVVS